MIMEKLINLINEHQKEKHPDGVYLEVVAYRDWIFWSDCCCTSSVMDEIHLISKNYWFIEWLVENNKIDFEKPIWEFANKYKLIVPDSFYLKELSKEDELLMLLAIQDNPIEFLISILK